MDKIKTRPLAGRGFKAGRLMKEGERGEGRGPKDRGGSGGSSKSKSKNKSDNKKQTYEFDSIKNLDQIEYLILQSTQGIHFIFDREDIIPILSQPSDDEEFYSDENMTKVHVLLSGFLDCQSLESKRSFLERLKKDDFELLVRAYFHLVENTILAHSKVRH
jgi:hypothetical protein